MSMKHSNISVLSGYCSTAAEHPDQAGNMRDVAIGTLDATECHYDYANALTGWRQRD